MDFYCDVVFDVALGMCLVMLWDSTCMAKGERDLFTVMLSFQGHFYSYMVATTNARKAKENVVEILWVPISDTIPTVKFAILLKCCAKERTGASTGDDGTDR